MAAAGRSRASASRWPSALLAMLGLHFSIEAFVSPARVHPRAPSRTAMRVKVFDIPIPAFFSNDEEDSAPAQSTGGRVDEKTGSRVVEVQMPLAVEFEERQGGDIFIKTVAEDSDAWAQGVRPDTQLVEVSATFGDEMWNTRGVGMKQFTTVVNSRFGGTIKLALKSGEEKKNILSNFLDGFSSGSKKQEEAAPKESKEDFEQRQRNLLIEFEREEARLADKDMWNPFR
eukprot:TRINITY_DN61373_c0_g1_i1.p2 TRINITY_DN61373_c0_g1~~TRINITY_DN61373_c0_g1_i1.p2  ORF type:complete len:252 (+),score=57.46 TRINITY_DN61373_c0_g1_i1:71-757(+)